jgi:hypothetical protein
MTLDIAQLRATPPQHPVDPTPEVYSFSEGGYRVEFRLPNSYDLAAIALETDVEQARGQLLARCITQVAYRNHHEPASPDQLPADLIAALAARLAEADPQAEIELALTCENCGANWTALLDIALFLWTEISARVRRLLREVHTLALAYGWREADILALSDARRQLYLEMVL